MDASSAAGAALRRPLLGARASSGNSPAAKDNFATQGDPFFAEGSVAASVVLLCSAAIGTGVLALPYGVKIVGVLPAMILFAIAGWAAYASNVILFRCVMETGKASYGELMTAILGKRGALLLDALIFVEGLGAIATYCVFIMDYVPKVCELAGDVWCTDPSNVIAAALVIIWPLSCLKGLSALRYVSTCSIMSITFTFFVVIMKAPKLSLATGEPLAEMVSEVHLNSNVFQVLSMACFAFMVHTNTPEIAARLRSPTRGRIANVVGLHTAFIWFVFSAIGVCGFVSFGSTISQDFLVNYEVSDIPATLCRCFISMTLVLACPINIFPAVQAFFNILETVRSPTMAAGRPRLYDLDGVRIPVVTASLAMSLGVALKTPQVADLISLISSFFSSPLMFAFPAFMYWRVLKGSDMVVPVALLSLTVLFWVAEIHHLLQPAELEPGA